MNKQMTAVAILALMAGTAMAAPRESQSMPNPVNFNGASLARESFTLSFTGSDGGGAYQATRILITGTLNEVAAATYGTEAKLDIVAPDGTAVTVTLSPILGYTGTTPVDVNTSLGASVSPAGTWTFEAYDTFDDALGATTDQFLPDGVVTLDDTSAAGNSTPETATDLGTLVDGVSASSTVIVDAGSTLWYKFTNAEANAATTRKVTVSTESSTNGGDSEIGVFMPDGTLVDFNDDFGTLFSRLTFGNQALDGDLAAGEHYVAVSTFNAEFATPFSVTTTSAVGNTFELSVIQELVGPPASTDLGTLADGVLVTAEAVVPPNGVVWYRATVGDVSEASGRALTVSTMSSTMGGDSMIAIYDSEGNGIIANDQFGGTDLSEITMGYQGLGDLAPGLYYIPVATWVTDFFVAGFEVVPVDSAGGTFNLTLLQTNSFPPVAVGAGVAQGTSELLTVTVTPGVNPDSTGIAVTGDLTSIGGSATQVFNDLGTNGDAVAGDNIFSYLAPLPGGGVDGATYTVTFAVTDQQSNNVTGDITFQQDVDGGTSTASTPSGSGPLDVLTGTFDFATDVDFFRIAVCDFASFSATTVGGATVDTRLWLFNADGLGVTFNDDSQATVQSTLTSTHLTANGEYYLAISRYTAAAVDADGNPLWDPADPFAAENAPSGTGAGNPVAGFTGGSFGTGDYTITFTGACYSSGTGPCSEADIGIAGGGPGQDGLLDNNDFIAFITYFFAQNPIADMGVAGGLPGSDSQWDNNDFIAFINHFFDDSAACNG